MVNESYSVIRSNFVAALMLYISILEKQAKFGDALEVLSGKLGSLLTIEVDKLRIQVISVAFFVFCNFWILYIIFIALKMAIQLTGEIVFWRIFCG